MGWAANSLVSTRAVRGQNVSHTANTLQERDSVAQSCNSCSNGISINEEVNGFPCVPPLSLSLLRNWSVNEWISELLTAKQPNHKVNQTVTQAKWFCFKGCSSILFLFFFLNWLKNNSLSALLNLRIESLIPSFSDLVANIKHCKWQVAKQIFVSGGRRHRATSANLINIPEATIVWELVFSWPVRIYFSSLRVPKISLQHYLGEWKKPEITAWNLHSQMFSMKKRSPAKYRLTSTIAWTLCFEDPL